MRLNFSNARIVDVTECEWKDLCILLVGGDKVTVPSVGLNYGCVCIEQTPEGRSNLPDALNAKDAESLQEMFTYHPVEPDQVRNYEAIREAAKQFAATVIVNTPSSPDRSAAIRKIREAVMTANASIALRGRF